MENQAIETLPMLVRMLTALIAVVALMGGLALVLKKFGLTVGELTLFMQKQDQ